MKPKELCSHLGLTEDEITKKLHIVANENKKVKLLLNYSKWQDWNSVLIGKIIGLFDDFDNKPFIDNIVEESIENIVETNVDNDSVDENLSDVELTDEEKYLALEAGGVDNWSYFGDAIEDTDWDDLTDEERFCVLWNAGVNNWEFYYESIEDFKKEKKGK